MESFLVIGESGFGLDNVPFGVFRLRGEGDEEGRCCSRIGDFVVDLSVLEENGYIHLPCGKIFNRRFLNDFIELGKECWEEVRTTIQGLFVKGSALERDVVVLSKAVIELDGVVMLMPVSVGDYTDFYSSKNHAYNVGKMFRGEEKALQDNWLWLPTAYHGRSSSIQVSPTDLNRPKGQIKEKEFSRPVLDKSQKIDFELEMATVIGKPSRQGVPVDIEEAGDHVFGYLLMNDVSARDVQKWEYRPLGPFTAKNFLTVVSAWIITVQALEPFKTKPTIQSPPPLEYLKDSNSFIYDIELKAEIKTRLSNSYLTLAKSNMADLYWTPAQQITHHTITGCNVRVGDLLGTGTISGEDQSTQGGSFIELSFNGKKPVKLSNGEERSFWEDHDTIRLTASATKGNRHISFGECLTTLRP